MSNTHPLMPPTKSWVVVLLWSNQLHSHTQPSFNEWHASVADLYVILEKRCIRVSFLIFYFVVDRELFFLGRRDLLTYSSGLIHSHLSFSHLIGPWTSNDCPRANEVVNALANHNKIQTVRSVCIIFGVYYTRTLQAFVPVGYCKCEAIRIVCFSLIPLILFTFPAASIMFIGHF